MLAQRIITAPGVFILVIRLSPFCRVSDAHGADAGSQSAGTIKLRFIRLNWISFGAAILAWRAAEPRYTLV